jgi:hypothetical protein
MGKDKKADAAKIAAKKARSEAKQKKNLTKRNKKELKETGEDDIGTHSPHPTCLLLHFILHHPLTYAFLCISS